MQQNVFGAIIDLIISSKQTDHCHFPSFSIHLTYSSFRPFYLPSDNHHHHLYHQYHHKKVSQVSDGIVGWANFGADLGVSLSASAAQLSGACFVVFVTDTRTNTLLSYVDQDHDHVCSSLRSLCLFLSPITPLTSV